MCSINNGRFPTEGKFSHCCNISLKSFSVKKSHFEFELLTADTAKSVNTHFKPLHHPLYVHHMRAAKTSVLYVMLLICILLLIRNDLGTVVDFGKYFFLFFKLKGNRHL